MDYKEQVKGVIAKALSVDRLVLTDDLSIGEIPEWDSVGNLTIIQEIEREMGVEIPMDDLFELTSIQQIVNEVNNLKNNDAQSRT
jgi:acyl carrier protein